VLKEENCEVKLSSFSVRKNMSKEKEKMKINKGNLNKEKSYVKTLSNNKEPFLPLFLECITLICLGLRIFPGFN